MCPGLVERMFAGRWIAGPGIRDAIREATKIEGLGVTPILDYLGEDYSKKSEVNDSVREYLRLIADLSKHKIKANISMKPTQLGLRMSRTYASKNYSHIVREARKAGLFVWIDMEDSSTTDDTLKMYMEEVRKGGVGICIQSYLERSADDIRTLTKFSKNTNIRLVKGAYTTTDSSTMKDKRRIDGNYRSLMRYLFSNSEHFTIATHDDKMIHEALRLSRKHRSDVTFSMLRGIRTGYLLGLAESGARTSMYVPFGKEWVSYSYRRLKEAGHMSLIFRSLFERGV